MSEHPDSVDVAGAPSVEDETPLATAVVDLLLAASRVIERVLDSTVSPHGLTLAQWSVLTALHAQGDRPLAQYQLSDLVEVSRPHITRLVDHLEQRGLVLREIRATERRVTYVYLSALGRQVVAETRDLHAAAQAWLVSGLPEGELRALRRSLGMLLAQVEAPGESFE